VVGHRRYGQRRTEAEAMTTTTIVVIWCAALTVAIAIVAVQLCRCGTRQGRRDEAGRG
jgi:hypothetical protein